MEIRRYGPADKYMWNGFVAQSKNGFFMFDRNYMDYHADRFKDHSLLVFHQNELCAILPANENNGTLYSHQGLTFGGFLTGKTMRAQPMLEVFEGLMGYLCNLGFDRLEYKAIPCIYHAYPAQEDLYALFRHDARIFRTDVSTTILLNAPYSLNKGKKAAISKAARCGVYVRENDNLEAYFTILNTRLGERFGKSSTHTSAEMRLLQSAFPENIKLYTAHVDNRMISGVLAYISSHVVHTQYIAATDEGLELGANECVIKHVMDVYKGQKPYLDFGISNEEHGMFLNTGLVAQKEHFGGRSIVHHFYEITV